TCPAVVTRDRVTLSPVTRLARYGRRTSRRASVPPAMNPLPPAGLRILRLESLGVDLFRGESRDLGYGRIFGGHVLGQALTAAYSTVEARHVHSLHAYFLRAGDPGRPILYEVDRGRDGT